MLGFLGQNCGGVVTGFYAGSVSHEGGDYNRHTTGDVTCGSSLEA